MPCGPGTRSRTLECFDIRFNPATKVVLSNCEQAGLAMPTTVSTCNLGACSATWWYSGPWGTCSETCGSDGIQTRTVECRTAGGDSVPDADVRRSSLEQQPCVHAHVCSNPAWLVCPAVYRGQARDTAWLQQRAVRQLRVESPRLGRVRQAVWCRRQRQAVPQRVLPEPRHAGYRRPCEVHGY